MIVCDADPRRAAAAAGAHGGRPLGRHPAVRERLLRAGRAGDRHARQRARALAPEAAGAGVPRRHGRDQEARGRALRAAAVPPGLRRGVAAPPRADHPGRGRRRRRPGAGALGPAAAREAARPAVLPDHADLPPARPARPPALSGPLRDRVRRAVPVLRRVPARGARGPARGPVHDGAGAPPHPGDGRRARARAARPRGDDAASAGHARGVRGRAARREGALPRPRGRARAGAGHRVRAHAIWRRIAARSPTSGSTSRRRATCRASCTRSASRARGPTR